MYDVSWLTLLSGTILPMIVALVTARLASGTVKSLILVVLSAVSGFVTALALAGGDLSLVDGNEFATQGVTAFLIAVGVHFGLLKPTGVTGSDGVIATSVTGGVGAGGRHAKV